jgi:hypothetical protein
VGASDNGKKFLVGMVMADCNILSVLEQICEFLLVCFVVVVVGSQLVL